MFLSLTRLKLRSLIFLLPFLIYNTRVAFQVSKSAGFIKGKLLFDTHLTFWTLTTWQDQKSMNTFRTTGVHLKVMPKLSKWCNEACVTHRDQTEEDIPTWEEAYEILNAEGHFTSLKCPSDLHCQKIIAKPTAHKTFRELSLPIFSKIC
jgi:hypothetical protein